MPKQRSNLSKDEKIYMALIRTAELMKKNTSAVFRTYGITFAQYNVLRYLGEIKGGQRTMTNTSKIMLASGPNMTGIAKRLEKKGLIIRKGDPRDERVTILEITPKGRKTLSNMIHVKDEILERLFFDYSDDEKSILHEGLTKIIKRVNQLNKPHKERPKYNNMNLFMFKEKFSTSDDCRLWLFHTRWPNGFKCPTCGHDKHTQISTRNLYKCQKCKHQTSITSGTIFHKTKTPLLKWFWLIFRMATSKNGVSIAEMQREIGINDYKTIWVMAHKIRKAMAERNAMDKVAALVEIDESFYGPSTSNKYGLGAEKKAKLIIAVSVWKDKDGKEKPGFAHAFVADDASAETIGSILKRIRIPDDEIAPLINAIRTDGWRSYKAVAKDFGLVHHRVILSDPKDTMKLLPWTHKLIANARAVFQGSHKGISTKHLQRYLSEVCYRFNRRFWNRQAFQRLLMACVSTSTITRDELMAPIMGEQSL